MMIKTLLLFCSLLGTLQVVAEIFDASYSKILQFPRGPSGRDSDFNYYAAKCRGKVTSQSSIVNVRVINLNNFHIF